MSMRIRTVSSLEKIFIDEELRAPEISSASALQNEVYSFQVAVFSPDTDNYRTQRVFKIDTVSDLPLEVRDVVSIPSEVPQGIDDANFLRNTPGLYPDLLSPVNMKYWRIPGDQWRALWVTVRIPSDCRCGKHAIKIELEATSFDMLPVENTEKFTAEFTLDVLPAALPAGKLLRYEWFHVDCLATYYNVPVWSEEHWQIIDKFMANAGKHDMNTLLTPLWTPPLDTAKGHERPTVQLLDISRTGSKYTFGFERLLRYVKMAQKNNIHHFTMSHAFTQWGATATPKIVATVDGREQRIFGWDVPSDSPEYENFLGQLMPQLFVEFANLGISDKVFFAVSDEPNMDVIDSYAKSATMFKSKIGDMPTIDALSRYEFYKRGLVERPAVSNDHIEPFVDNVKEMWTYYCVGQAVKVPNRFFAMPSARTRIMGLMLYIYKAVGFLQWGFNFYYSQYSLYPVDPYRDSTAGRWVPSGDAFIVYPGKNGEAYDSLRHEVFFDGLQDLRALQALEAKIGRDAVLKLVHEGLDYELKMDRYPWSADWLLAMRDRVNRALAK